MIIKEMNNQNWWFCFHKEDMDCNKTYYILFRLKRPLATMIGLYVITRVISRLILGVRVVYVLCVLRRYNRLY